MARSYYSVSLLLLLKQQELLSLFNYSYSNSLKLLGQILDVWGIFFFFLSCFDIFTFREL